MAQNKLRPIPTQRTILKMLKIYGKPNIDTEKQKNYSDEKRYSKTFIFSKSTIIYFFINIYFKHRLKKISIHKSIYRY